MAEKNKGLTEDDLKRLAEDKTGEVRAQIARKLSRQYSADTGGALSEQSLQLAEEIFRILAKDAEKEVRKALADNLKHSGLIPKDIAISLAEDMEGDVAIPMLEYSDILEDADLIHILEAKNDIASQTAIAKRSKLSAELSDALVESSAEEVVNILLKNKGAEIKEETFNKVAESFADSQEIIDSLAINSSLPHTIAKKIMAKVSDDVKAHIEKKYAGKVEDIDKIIDKTKNLAENQVQASSAKEKELKRAAKIARQDVSISPINALCLGSINLFYSSMAKHSSVPLSNVKKLLAFTGDVSFRSIVKTAGVPDKFIDAVQVLLDALKSLDREDKDAKKKSDRDFIERYLERIDEIAGRRTKKTEGLEELKGMIIKFDV